MNRKPHLLIADDMLTAQCLQRLLEGEFPGVEIVSNGLGLLDAAIASRPDLVLLDIRMPAIDGLEATRRLREALPGTRVIVVTMHDEPEYYAGALRAGASGYVLKSCAVSELVNAIHTVSKGLSYVTPSVAARVASPIMTIKSRPHSRSLTARQREVLELVAQGRTAKEIANTLSLSVKTAVFHKMAIMDKLGLRTTADLTRYALEHGILTNKFSVESASPSPSMLRPQGI